MSRRPISSVSCLRPRPLTEAVEDRRLRAGPSRRVVVIGSSLFLVAALVAVAVALSGRWDAWAAVAGAEGVGWRLRPWWLLGAVICEVLAILAGAALWASVFRACGACIGVREGVSVWLGTQLARYLPGKIWQATGLVAYVRARGDSGVVALTVGLVLQAGTVATGVGIAAAVLGPRSFGAIGPWSAIIGALAIAAALSPPVLRATIRLGRRLLKESPDSEPPAVQGRVLLQATLGCLVLWLPQGLGFWLLLEGMLASNPLGPIEALGVFAAAYVAGYLVILAPAGMVVREAAMASLLGLAAGLPIGPAAALALAARLWSTVSEVVAFGIATAVSLSARRR